MWLDNKSYSYSGGKMVDGNFDITWIPVNYDLTNFIGVSHSAVLGDTVRKQVTTFL